MKIAICAALYVSGRPFLADFIRALRGAASQGAALAHDVIFVAAIDGLENSGDALADLAGQLDIISVDVPVGRTPAGVRGAMLTAGQASGADILVFIDMDDVIAPQGLDRHLDALARADFSYGDLELIDARGHRLGRRFFDHARVPDRVEDVLTIRDLSMAEQKGTTVGVRP